MTGALVVAIRVAHIAATCTSFGGLFYARMVLLPTLDRLPEPERKPFLDAMVRRFQGFKWAGVVVVAVTGLIQLGQIWPMVADPGSYLAAFALKMVSAFGLVTITGALAIPDVRFDGMRQQRGFWSAINLGCALGILTGAALMRYARLGVGG